MFLVDTIFKERGIFHKMISFCIKTNNKQIIDYLLKKIEASSSPNIYFINKKFKNYENVIVHYKGNNQSLFYGLLTDIITDCILFFYESHLIKRILYYNYFYFDDFEKKIIEEICFNHITFDEDNNLKYRKEEIWTRVLQYITENKSMILDGFVNFRIDNYMNTLEEIVDYGVNQYIVEKEYTEFINLLKLYIDSKEPLSSIVHLVYTNGESILLNENRNLINLEDDIFSAKYLSDISFSSNDYALNALLTLLPKKIEIHIIGNENEFINTLKLIFGTRISICRDCSLCRTYKVLNNVNR